MARFTSERGQNVQVCLNVNPARPGAAYGYVDMGGWIGGQVKLAVAFTIICPVFSHTPASVASYTPFFT